MSLSDQLLMSAIWTSRLQGRKNPEGSNIDINMLTCMFCVFFCSAQLALEYCGKVRYNIGDIFENLLASSGKCEVSMKSKSCERGRQPGTCDSFCACVHLIEKHNKVNPVVQAIL